MRTEGRLGRPELWGAAIALGLYSALLLRVGAKPAGDTVMFGAWGDSLASSHFNYSAYMHMSLPVGAHSALSRGFYHGFVTTVAVLRLVAREQWVAALAWLNVVSLGVVFFLIVRSVRRASESLVAPWIAIGMLLLCVDLATWTRYALSDVTFTALVTLVLTLSVRAASKRSARSDIALGAAAVIAISYRPTGFLILPLVAAAAWQRLPERWRNTLAPRRIIGLTVAAFVMMTLVLAYFSQHPDRYPIAPFRRAVQVKSQTDSTGAVVSKRAETYHASPTTYADFALLTPARAVRFLQLSSGTFSAKHNASGVALSILVVLGLLGLRADNARLEERTLIAMSLVLILSFQAFIALTFLDYDWRYRLPVMPAFAAIAALGGQRVLRLAKAATVSFRPSANATRG